MTAPAGLAPLAARPERTAFVSDFDGTLAPIVDDPTQARPRPDALAVLADLAAALRLVAVVSGRPVAFLRDHVPVHGVVLVGQYGLERLVDGEVIIDPRVDQYRAAVAEAAAEVQGRFPAVLVERKGAAGFGVHWRTRPEAAPPAGALVEVAAAHGLVFLTSRMAGELRVPIPVDKGTVVQSLLEDPGLVAAGVAGDDVGDLPAFAALADRDAQGDGFVGVRVAVRSGEAPAPLLEHADLVVDGPAGLVTTLEELAVELRRRG